MKTRYHFNLQTTLQEGRYNIETIKNALEKLRDVIKQELSHNLARDINIELVRKLREIEKEIRECL